ncbi:hypothetical protein [Terriglobus aquaticus]|uniref:Uncharacterized protein n=1 Tax=Terriglobus aquaticus TaxID=940139 RepID=A0ABW9KN68_9BACT|nr:hypothetical protein [Terriglobus aquaticus]
MKILDRLSVCMLAAALVAPAVRGEQHTWRSATESELAQALPARAPVEHERIETEMRTASGIVDEQGHVTAGVVLITAGYSADGKYSHYLIVAAPLRVGGLLLPPGKYVLGWKRSAEGLDVHLYDAASGQQKGSALARLLPAGTRVEPFRISPPGEHGIVQIGRFGIPYTLVP